VVIKGNAEMKSKAVAAAENSIDRALASKKVRLDRPEITFKNGDRVAI
jgi:hypothetical protein